MNRSNMSRIVAGRRQVLRALGGVGLLPLIGCGAETEGSQVGEGQNGGGAPGSGGESSPGGSVSTGGIANTGGTSSDAGQSSGDSGPPSLCIVRPRQTEGPYFIDERLERSDIRSDPTDGSLSEGAELLLELGVFRIDGTGCIPIEGALVDVWQCDAAGVYAGVVDAAGQFDTSGRKFLRGYQLTDAAGVVRFVTIYPGWYTGRTVHIHFKVRLDPNEAAAFDFTSQLYFDDALTDVIAALPPYDARGARTTRNARDGIFQSGGADLMLDVREVGSRYETRFDLGLDVS